jgi:hypothetical protein
VRCGPLGWTMGVEWGMALDDKQKRWIRSGVRGFVHQGHAHPNVITWDDYTDEELSAVLSAVAGGQAICCDHAEGMSARVTIVGCVDDDSPESSRAAKYDHLTRRANDTTGCHGGPEAARVEHNLRWIAFDMSLDGVLKP